MITEYPNLFSPLKVGNLLLRNRILSGPNMMCCLNPDGSPTEYMIGYYEEKAKGGCAQITVGDTPVEERGATNPRHPVLSRGTLNRWSEVARAIRQHGAVASIELNHGGRISNPSITGFNPIGPVAYVKPNGVAVASMDNTLMNEVADAFANAAKLAYETGFDMCMLHGAHGWLLSQFLSPKFNTRTDEFGGSLINRAKFPIMVIDRIHSVVGPKFPIEYRVGAELIEGGLTIEEVIAFLKLIEDKVDLIHVSAGLDTDPNYAVKTHPTIFLPHCTNVHFASAVKNDITKIPVVAVGAINTAAEAEAILSSGKSDAVAMVRALIADPYLPQKARLGKAEETRPCLRCLDCLTGMQASNKFACAVNPRVGHEFRLDATEKPVKEQKRVLIIGGGPGGMQAAMTAAQRGHLVTLAEKSDKLGGLLKFTDYDTLKSDLRNLKDYMIRMTENSGARILFNTEADAEFVKEFAPDAVIVAIGSGPIVPKIPGIELAKHATEVYFDLVSLGHSVAVIGGGLVGCETALFLTGLGKKVTIIEMQNSIAPEANWMHRTAMLQAFGEADISIKTGLRCTGISEEGVLAVAMDGVQGLIEAESVVYAIGMRSNSQLAEELQELYIPYFSTVGDCKQVQKVSGAIFAAYHAAMDI